MKTFWMVIFLFSSNGEFTGKLEYEYASKAECVSELPKELKKQTKDNQTAEGYCVSDDHFFGRSVDKDIPLD